MIAEPFERVVTPRTLREAFSYAFAVAKQVFEDEGGHEIVWKLLLTPVKSTRSLQANACMWAHLTDISRQVVWYGNKLDPSEWKDVISAGLKKQKIVPDIFGTGFVSIGARTSKMSIKEMSDMIELSLSFGIEHGVKFMAPKWMAEE